MKARFGLRRGRDGTASLSARLKASLAVLLVVSATLVGLVATSGGNAGAQIVGNPGPINFKIVGGQIILGTQNFDLTPETAPQCSDGKNNDDGQDTLIDYPADPDCTSPLDDSEVASGFQPHQDTTITGTVTSSGAVTVPQSGVFFPPVYQYSNGAVLTINISPTAAGTGTINPLTGAATLSITIRLQIQGSPSGVSLGSSCYIGPFTLAMTTGPTNPPAPNTPITGVPYDSTTGTATTVDNSFAVPGASGCGPLGLANGSLNTALGIPSAAGLNTAILQLGGTPIIAKGVVASNVPSTTSGNRPLNVSFNGTGSTASTGKTITNYSWDFGDGSPLGSGSTTSHIYTSAGTYTSKLTVTDSDGDKDSQTKVITATIPPNVPPTAAIGASGSGGITPQTISFDGSGSNDPDGSIASYAWDDGNGHTGTGPTFSTTYSTAGTYTTTLTVTDNQAATGTATKVITVLPVPDIPPTAAITTVSAAGTIPYTVNLSAANSNDPDGSIVSYHWDFGNGDTADGLTAQANYVAAGSYTITLTVTDDQGATGTDTTTVDVSSDPNLPPSATFTADTVSGTAPLTVHVDGSGSSDGDGTIAGYAWNFGNGGNAAGPTASTTYALPGTYTAKLTVTDNRGATGTAVKTITVTAPPNQVPTASVHATPSSGTAPLLVQLSSAGSVDPDGAITGYAWTFGNGATSTKPSPSAVYNDPGTYTVTLTVTDNQGATAVKSTTVTVAAPNQPPVPSFTATPTTGSAPLLVNVNGASSTDPDGSIASYAWSFGDGHTATGPVASNTYANPGSYQLKLTVTDNGGASRSTTQTVVAGATNQKPIASITAVPTSGPAPLAVTMTAAGSYDPDGTIVKYAWDFGNGQTALGSATQVTYGSAGTYVITLTVTDNKGATASTTEVAVADPPAAVTDRMRIQLTGALSDVFDGPISSGNLHVVTDSFGVSSISGTAGFVGTHGTGTVTVSLTRFLIFNAFSGTITVSDPGNGISQSTPVILAPLTRPSATSVRGSVTGQTAQFKGYTLAFTFDDRA